MTSPTVLESSAESIPEPSVPAVQGTVGRTPAEARRSILIVLSCTVIGAAAQILMKLGSVQVGAHVSLAEVARHPAYIVQFAIGIFGNPKLFLGYCLYGVMTFLMAAALKGRELSRLYPIIALTYVWVTLLSVFLLPGEHLNFFRTIGLAFIVGGVSVLGMKK